MKGFTLIELLAVIVILAIILLIAVPVISGVIESAKKGSFESSTELLKKAAINEYFKRQLESSIRGVQYNFSNYIQTADPSDVAILDFNGKGPKKGYILVEKDGNITIHVTDGKYYIETDSSGKLKDSVAYNPDIHDVLLVNIVDLWTGPFEFEVTIPVGGDTFSFGSVDTNLTINWGDGVEETFTYTGSDYITHDYLEGTFEVSVTGTSEHISFCNVDDFSTIWACPNATPTYLTDITKPVPISMGLSSANAMFAETDVAAFSRSDFFDQASINIVDMSYMFANTDNFNQSLENWNTTKVVNMAYMFVQNYLFDQLIDNWDVSNVTDMSGMFTSACFNQTLNNWDVSSVTNMSEMFSSSCFDQPLNNWDVSSVTNMESMFASSDFSQPIGNWDVSNVTNMRMLFTGAYRFNQPIGNWNTSKVTDMSRIFMINEVFNQNIEDWDTSNVTDMSQAFSGAIAFNQNLSSWCVTNLPAKPASFDNNTTSWVLSRPIWGTCP